MWTNSEKNHKGSYFYLDGKLPTFINLGYDVAEPNLPHYFFDITSGDIFMGNIEIHLNEKKSSCCFNHSQSTKKQILDKVTGSVQPGEFPAIMGASGAGKTTLLNCLTLINTGKLKISGERYLNGAVVNTDILARISGYVQQNDLFVPTLTVKEHLQFLALLRMDKLLIPLLYIGGIFLCNGSVPVYLDWMRYLSWFMYGNEALSINQWAGVSFNDMFCPNKICAGEQILQSHSFNPDFSFVTLAACAR